MNPSPLFDFDRFLAERERASSDFVEGRFEFLHTVSTDDDPASIFPPPGTVVNGAAAVDASNEKGAQSFLPGAQNRFEILHRDADYRIGYWTGIQRSIVRMQGKKEPVVFNRRVTEIFRKEGGGWKLVHRHADALKQGLGGTRKTTSPVYPIM